MDAMHAILHGMNTACHTVQLGPLPFGAFHERHWSWYVEVYVVRHTSISLLLLYSSIIWASMILYTYFYINLSTLCVSIYLYTYILYNYIIINYIMAINCILESYLVDDTLPAVNPVVYAAFLRAFSLMTISARILLLSSSS